LNSGARGSRCGGERLKLVSFDAHRSFGCIGSDNPTGSDELQGASSVQSCRPGHRDLYQPSRRQRFAGREQNATATEINRFACANELHRFRLEYSVPNFRPDWEPIILAPIERSSEELPFVFLF
jgi:hypothetical protein